MDAATRTGSVTGNPTGSLEGRRTLRLLITSAGRRAELLQCFRASAAEMGVELEVHACDLVPGLSAACRLADRAWAVPRGDDPSYAEAVLTICAEQGISLVVPTIDTELEALSEARDRFAGVGTDVAISSPELVAIARDKLATAMFLAEHGIPSPRTILLGDDLHGLQYPLLAKPRHGSASRGIRVVRDSSQLQGLDADEPMVLQQGLTGVEYTVNMYFDDAGQLRCAIPHERLQIRAGEVEKGRTLRMPALERIAEQMAEALPGPRGVLCFQAFVDAEGRASVFEINARFGGGYPLAHHAGATMARWLLEERLGLPCSAHNNWREGVAMLRYDAAVFVES